MTAQRWQTLGGTNTVAKQTVDEKTGDLTVKQALTRAAKANVDRLEVLADFKRLIAPFDGIVTTRNTDVGAPDQRRFERRPRPVRHLRHAEAQGQRQHPAELRAGGEDQHQGADHRARVSRQDLLRASSRPRRAPSMPQTGTTRMQLVVDNARGRADAGRLRQHAHRAAGEPAGAQHPGRRADLRPEGPARGDRGRQQQGRAEDHHHRPRSRPGGRDRHRHRRDRPHHRQPARWPVRTAIRCGSSRPRRRRRARPQKNPAHGRRARFVRDMVPLLFFRSSACRLRLPGTNGSRSFGAASPFCPVES